jgi:hypothetical protein
MVPQATNFSIGNVVISKYPIGTPLLLRSNPSLPLGYHALNTSIDILAQNPSGESNLFIPPRYNVAANFFPKPA